MLPPLHPGLPIVGNLFDVQSGCAEFFRTVALDEPIHRFQAGPITLVQVADVEHVGRVMSSNYRNYTKGTKAYAMFRDVIGNGMLTSDGETWKHQRRVAGPAFRAPAIEALAGQMREAGQSLAAKWAVGSPVDAMADVQHCTMSVAGRVFLGDAMGTHTETLRLAFEEALRLTTKRINATVTPPLWLPTPTNHRFKRAVQHLDGVLLGVIAERRKRPVRDDVLGQFLGAGEADDRVILDQVKTLFTAGFETLSTALIWSIYELGRHPEWLAAIRAEAEVAFAEPVSRETLGKLPITRAVFKETLRHYPPVWTMSRTPIEDDVIGGFDIPKGTWVFVSPYTLHHLPDLWPDPMRWDPNRFLDGAEEGRHKHAWVPFLAGPRKCIGDHFAMMEGMLVLASLAERVTWETVGEVLPTPIVTLRPDRPVRVRVALV
jgi:cytochrome P450